MGNKTNVLPYEEKRHYNRHPKLKLADGTEVKPLRTRYTDRWKTRRSKKTGPRGGKRYEQFPQMVYYHERRFWHHVNVKQEDGSYLDAIEPLSGLIWDAHPIQSVEQGIPVLSIWCEDGVPYRAEHEDFGTVWQTGDDIAELEDWLHIDGRQERRGRKAA